MGVTAPPDPVHGQPLPVQHASRSRPLPAGRRARIAGGVLMLLVVLAAGVATGPAPATYLAAAANARAIYRYDVALRWYAAASALVPHDPQPWCLSGDVLMLQQQWHPAVSAYRRCLALDSADAHGWLGLGDARSALHDQAGALAAWQHAADVGDPTALHRLAHAAEASGDAAAATALWRKLPASDGEALAHRGILALLRGDGTAAQQDFITLRGTPGSWADQMVADGFVLLAAQMPLDAAGLGRLGYDLLGMGLPVLAIAPLRQSIAQDATAGAPRAYLGWAPWLTRQKTAAAQQVALAVKLNPGLAFAWYASAELALAKNDAATAESDLRQALHLNANNPVVWSALGHLLIYEQSYFEADIALTNAAQLSLQPAYAIDLLNFYVSSHYGLNDNRALTAALTATQRFPQNSMLAYLLARIYDLLGQPAQAYYAAVHAQALDGTNPGPYVLLGEYAEQQGFYINAVLYLRTALALQPAGPYAAQARALLAPIAVLKVDGYPADSARTT